jgi:ribosomal protein L34E
MSNLSISSNPKPFPGCHCPKCSILRNNTNISKNISSIETTTYFNLSNQKSFTASEAIIPSFTKSRINNDYSNNFPKKRRNTLNSDIQRPFPGCNCQKCRNLRNN